MHRLRVEASYAACEHHIISMMPQSLFKHHTHDMVRRQLVDVVRPFYAPQSCGTRSAAKPPAVARSRMRGITFSSIRLQPGPIMNLRRIVWPTPLKPECTSSSRVPLVVG